MRDKPVADMTGKQIAAAIGKPQRKRRLTELLAEADHRRNVKETK